MYLTSGSRMLFWILKLSGSTFLKQHKLLLLDLTNKFRKVTLYFFSKLTLHPFIELFSKYRWRMSIQNQGFKLLSRYVYFFLFFFLLLTKMATPDARASKNHQLVCAFSKTLHYFTWSCSEFLFHPSYWFLAMHFLDPNPRVKIHKKYKIFIDHIYVSFCLHWTDVFRDMLSCT